MRRALLGFLIAIWLVPGAGRFEPVAASTPPTTVAGDDTVVTLAEDLDISDCVSALPDPRCRTREDADLMQLAVLGVLLAAIALIGWRIARSVRQRDRAQRSRERSGAAH